MGFVNRSLIYLINLHDMKLNLVHTHHHSTALNGDE